MLAVLRIPSRLQVRPLAVDVDRLFVAGELVDSCLVSVPEHRALVCRVPSELAR